MRRARSARIALALFLAALGAGAHAAEVVIGVGLPLSGPKRALGEGMRLALERDAADFNARGGILGSPVRLVFADDGCQPSTAETAARTLLTEAPAVVIGHPCSGAALAASRIYAAAPGTLFIAAGARHPALTDSSRQPGPQTVFRLAGRDDQQGRAGATWLLKKAPAKRIAIIHDRTAYARAIADDAVQALKEAGISEVPVLTLVSGKAAYPEVQSELKRIDAEAVLFAGYPDEAVIVLAAARREGLRLGFLGSDSLATPEFARRVASDGGVRVLLRLEPGDISDEGSNGPMSRRVEAALELWGRAVGAANSLDHAAVAAALRGGDFETRALGRVSFDARGDSREPSFGAAEAAGERWKPGSE
jgi:branched-chain amino acid transport system substrate-binding protein